MLVISQGIKAGMSLASPHVFVNDLDINRYASVRP